MSETIEMDDLELASGMSRRQLMGRVGGAALAMSSVGMLAGCGGSGSPSLTAGPSDVDILNFALNLEYLEAEFYTVATTGGHIDAMGIGITGTGTPGPTTGGSKVAFVDQELSAIALEIATDERTHVTVLRTALGANAVAKPAINLAALGIGYASDAQFLALARAFEDVGVSAYTGAAPLITSKAYLQTAASILAAEAEHVANIRLKVKQAAVATSALDSKDILPPPSGTNYFSLDSNALAVPRSTREVLNIVYASAGASGGFFPNGLNGTIKS